jgi:putative hydrolase of the HAD superfamily
MGEIKCVLFDWGDTVMREFPDCHGPMHLWPKVETIEGITEAIEQIQDGRVIALASNAVDSQEGDIRKALNRVGLNLHFDRVYCFNKIGFMKPSPQFFDHILKELDLPTEGVIMVGDDFESDVLGANDSGIFAIWFNERSGEQRKGEMHDTIHWMAQLPAAIARRQGTPIQDDWMEIR